MNGMATDMVNDRLDPWFMRALQASNLVALVKKVPEDGSTPDYRPVACPEAFSKAVDKAVLKDMMGEYVQTLAPQQLGVGVKHAAELHGNGGPNDAGQQLRLHCGHHRPGRTRSIAYGGGLL